MTLPNVMEDEAFGLAFACMIFQPTDISPSSGTDAKVCSQKRTFKEENDVG